MADQEKRPGNKISFDLIVVGAGLAGGAAAAIAARGGMNVALIERGQTPGGKNYFGGMVYTHSLTDIYPDLWERKPPVERPVTEAGYWLLSRDGLVRMTVQGGQLKHQPADSFITNMAVFDAWWIEQAQKEGAFLIPKTTVIDFLRADGKVTGVVTDRPQGEIYAPVTIICEGVNNTLTQKLGLIDHDLKLSKVALACKQLISLPAETVNARFGLPDKSHGLAVSVLGDISMGRTGMGFLYTGEQSVSLGVGINLDILEKYKIRPYELLQRYLNHPNIAPLISGGKLLEYGAHLIPEGGWKEMPRLYGDGVMVAGDAAAMVNAIHWEGTNMAILAGKLAAETALQAHLKHDFSARMLSLYRKKLSEGFILKDLYQYRNLSRFLNTHPEFMDVYPNFVNDAMGMFLNGFGKPKKQLYGEILRALTKRRSLFRAAGDLFSLGRAVMGW